jgi:predicted dithiol-disulfide oxidoreductase (DUF899 family)
MPLAQAPHRVSCAGGVRERRGRLTADDRRGFVDELVVLEGLDHEQLPLVGRRCHQQPGSACGDGAGGAGPRTARRRWQSSSTGARSCSSITSCSAPAYTAGCPVCSSAADTFDGAVAHLGARDVTFLCISRAPLEKLQAYERRMGWSFPWVSSHGSDFNFDFGASHTEEELTPVLQGNLGPVPGLAAECGTDPAGYLSEGPVLSAFSLEDGTSTTRTRPPRAASNSCLATTGSSIGRPRDATRAARPRMWIRRHDEYQDAS